jgi:hypothetical protein
VLVTACHGNDQPHCAILEKLSWGSPAEHQPQHKPQIKKAHGKAEEPGAGTASHIDLMAWMRGVQVHQSAH